MFGGSTQTVKGDQVPGTADDLLSMTKKVLQVKSRVRVGTGTVFIAWWAFWTFLLRIDICDSKISRFNCASHLTVKPKPEGYRLLLPSKAWERWKVLSRILSTCFTQ